VVTQPHRGVPDVAGNADPDTGFHVLVDGQQEVVGGTSAAAPLWAGLIVLLNQKLNRRLGFVNPHIYEIDQASGFRDINLGNNGAYYATFGWDPVTGMGTPMGAQLLQALQGAGTRADTQKTGAQRKETTHAMATR
jgi:kumamolisin